jgi:hypothetical protein
MYPREDEGIFTARAQAGMIPPALKRKQEGGAKSWKGNLTSYHDENERKKTRNHAA